MAPGMGDRLRAGGQGHAVSVAWSDLDRVRPRVLGSRTTATTATLAAALSVSVARYGGRPTALVLPPATENRTRAGATSPSPASEPGTRPPIATHSRGVCSDSVPARVTLGRGTIASA